MLNKKLIGFIAMLISPISGLSIDIYVPALPAVSHYFAVSKALTQLSITTYILGMGFIQLFAGSLADSWGRRKPLLAALMIYLLTTLCIPFSSTIYYLLILRLIQGMSAGVIAAPMRAIIVDLFEGRELQKMMSYLTTAWAIGPIIAPAIGGYLQYYFGWQATFYFLAVYGLLLLLLSVYFVPETAKTFHPFSITLMFARYREILTHWQFVSGLICLGLLYGFLILFGVVCPFLVQNILHYSAITFGHVALLMGIAWFLGNITNRLLLDVAMAKKIACCLWAMLMAAVVMLMLSYYYGTTLYTLTLPTFVLFYFGGIVFPNYFTQNAAIFPHMAATASALSSAGMILITSAGSAAGTLLKSTTQIPLTGTYVVMVCVAVSVFYASRRNPAV